MSALPATFGVSLVAYWEWILGNPIIAGCVVIATVLLLWLWWDAIQSAVIKDRINAEAKARAEALLRTSVCPEQYEQLRRIGYLEIPSSLYPARRYRLPRRRRRVQVIEAGRKIGELCVVAVDPVPDADLVLTHKWMIEGDEEGYLALANWMR